MAERIPRSSAHIIVVMTTIAVLMCARTGSSQTDPLGPNPELTHVGGGVYELRAGTRRTILVVTADGIVLADPLSRTIAEWLRAELDRRFPGVPVRYVVHTHHRFDRAEGAFVFAKTADVIGHVGFSDALIAARTTIPAALSRFDLNATGRFEPAEIAAMPDPAVVASHDRDGDGTVTPDELYRFVQDVKNTFEARRIISIGGTRIEIIHPGPLHAPEAAILSIPDDRLVFALEAPGIRTVPFSFGGSRPRDVVTWFTTVASLEFDTLLTGDGESFSRMEIVPLSEYLSALTRDVHDRYFRGESLARIQQGATVDAYRGSPHYAGRTTQISQIYARLGYTQISLSGIGISDYSQRRVQYCAGFATCRAAGAVAGGTAGVYTALGRRIGVAVEVALPQQSWHSRSGVFRDEEIALRETTTSVLVRYGTVRTRALSFGVLAGPAIRVRDVRGMYRERDALAPLGGRHPIDLTVTDRAVTAGADIAISLSRRISLALPIRVTRGRNSPAQGTDFWPSTWSARAGVGLTLDVARGVRE